MINRQNFGIAVVFIALLMLMTSAGFFFQQENMITGSMVRITGMDEIAIPAEPIITETSTKPTSISGMLFIGDSVGGKQIDRVEPVDYPSTVTNYYSGDDLVARYEHTADMTRSISGEGITHYTEVSGWHVTVDGTYNYWNVDSKSDTMTGATLTDDGYTITSQSNYNLNTNSYDVSTQKGYDLSGNLLSEKVDYKNPGTSDLQSTQFEFEDGQTTARKDTYTDGSIVKTSFNHDDDTQTSTIFNQEGSIASISKSNIDGSGVQYDLAPIQGTTDAFKDTITGTIYNSDFDPVTATDTKSTSIWGDHIYQIDGSDAEYYIATDKNGVEQVYQRSWGIDQPVTYTAEGQAIQNDYGTTPLDKTGFTSVGNVNVAVTYQGDGVWTDTSGTTYNNKQVIPAGTTSSVNVDGKSVSVTLGDDGVWHDSDKNSYTNSQVQSSAKEQTKQQADIKTKANQAAASSALYSLTSLALEELFGEYYFDITDYCKSEWGSSESASGDTATTATDESIPSVSNDTNETVVDYCSGINATVGAAEYVITDNTTFYHYDYTWTLQPCKQDITYSIYFDPGTYEVEKGTAYYGNETLSDLSSFDSPDLYTEMCIGTDDTSFGTDGIACFPPSSIPTRTEPVTINDECQPIGTMSENNSYDIYLASNNYEDLTTFSQDALNSASLIAYTSPFSESYSNGQLNFYSLNNLFEDAQRADIRTYGLSYCTYTYPQYRFAIILNKNIQTCEQTGYSIEINPMFTFKENASNSMLNMLIDFCSYVEVSNYPPQAIILTPNMTTHPDQVTVEFQVADEEYPVKVELLMNNISVMTLSAKNSSLMSHTVNIPSGNWLLQIKATDKTGNIGYSNVLSVSTSDLIIVDFSSFSPLTMPADSSISIDLNSYAYDPRNDAFVQWVHEPPFSTCVTFEPYDTITDGYVTVISSGEPCQDTFVFEVIGSGNRRAQGTIVINVE